MGKLLTVTQRVSVFVAVVTAVVHIIAGQVFGNAKRIHTSQLVAE